MATQHEGLLFAAIDWTIAATEIFTLTGKRANIGSFSVCFPIITIVLSQSVSSRDGPWTCAADMRGATID